MSIDHISTGTQPSELVKNLEQDKAKVDKLQGKLFQTTEVRKEQTAILIEDAVKLQRAMGGRLLSQQDKQWLNGLLGRAEHPGYVPNKSELKKLSSIVGGALQVLKKGPLQGVDLAGKRDEIKSQLATQLSRLGGDESERQQGTGILEQFVSSLSSSSDAAVNTLRLARRAQDPIRMRDALVGCEAQLGRLREQVLPAIQDLQDANRKELKQGMQQLNDALAKSLPKLSQEQIKELARDIAGESDQALTARLKQLGVSQEDAKALQLIHGDLQGLRREETALQTLSNACKTQLQSLEQAGNDGRKDLGKLLDQRISAQETRCKKEGEDRHRQLAKDLEAGKVDGETFNTQSHQIDQQVQPQFAELRELYRARTELSLQQARQDTAPLLDRRLSEQDLKQLPLSELKSLLERGNTLHKDLTDRTVSALKRYQHDDLEAFGVGRRGVEKWLEGQILRLQGEVGSKPDQLEKEGLEGINTFIKDGKITAEEGKALLGALQGSIDASRQQQRALQDYLDSVEKVLKEKAQGTVDRVDQDLDALQQELKQTKPDKLDDLLGRAERCRKEAALAMELIGKQSSDIKQLDGEFGSKVFKGDELTEALLDKLPTDLRRTSLDDQLRLDLKALQGRLSESDYARTVNQLTQLVESKDLHSDLEQDRYDLLGEVVKDLAEPWKIAQKDKGTCAATVGQIALALDDPARYVKIMTALASQSGDASGIIPGLKRPEDVEVTMYSREKRSVTVRLMSPSFMALASDGRYSDKQDKHLDESGKGHGGLNLGQFERYFKGVTGIGVQNIQSQAGDAKLLQRLSEEVKKGAVPVALDWHGEGAHEVLVTGLDDKFAYMINPWGDMHKMPIQDFRARLWGISVPERPIKVLDNMRVDQAENKDNYTALEPGDYQSMEEVMRKLPSASGLDKGLVKQFSAALQDAGIRAINPGGLIDKLLQQKKVNKQLVARLQQAVKQAGNEPDDRQEAAVSLLKKVLGG